MVCGHSNREWTSYFKPCFCSLYRVNKKTCWGPWYLQFLCLVLSPPILTSVVNLILERLIPSKRFWTPVCAYTFNHSLLHYPVLLLLLTLSWHKIVSSMSPFPYLLPLFSLVCKSHTSKEYLCCVSPITRIVSGTWCGCNTYLFNKYLMNSWVNE